MAATPTMMFGRSRSCLVLMRSRRLLLELLRAGDQLIWSAQAASERPIRGLLDSRGLVEVEFEDALFL